ncbi:MAG: elongation factor G [Coriobacteriales bacterium]|jgi:elongation factor G|nr:elongation factor G [Coriobacteriales bacterium]
MAAPSTEQVRNIVLVGQDGAGKTSFAEALLHLTGKTNRLGTTHDGKSNLDYDPDEIKRGFTISAAIAPVHYKDFKINILDTSGSDDFLGDTVAAMEAAEMALFVIDAVAGPQINTVKLWEEADREHLCRAFFINHIDREHADFDSALANLVDKFGQRVGAVTIPIGVDADFKGVIDIIRMKAHYHADGTETVAEIPSELATIAQMARDKLCDLVAEADDDLMMKYLDGEEQLTQEELEGLLGKAIQQEIFIPVFVGSTLIEQGIEGILDDIVTYFPEPTAHGPIFTDGGEKLVIDDSGEPAFFVFKTMSDAFVGRLSFVKVLSGTLEPGQELINASTGKKDRIAHLYVMCGKETEDVKSARAGDIIVIPKLSDAHTGDTFSVSGTVKIAPLPFPRPLYPVAIEAANKKDEDKLGDFLSKTAELDPCIKLHRDEQTHQTILTTLGEGVVDLVLSRLKDRSGIEAKLLEVKVPYRETIRKKAEAQGRHKKQTGGAGQFGDCWVRLEPNPGGGYEYVDEVVGGKIPRGLIPAVDKGIRDALQEGFLTDDPFVDVKAAVYDGSYHPVDSNEMAFRQAGRLAFRNACEKADPYLLEPMANLEVTVTEEYAGTIMGDFSTRRGRVGGMSSDEAGRTVIKARVPYKEVVSYSRDLRSMTRGIGSYTIELEGYEEVPSDISKKLVADYQARREEGNK